MAKSHGKKAVFKLDNAAASITDLSQYVDTSELARTVEMAETSSYADESKKFVPGLKDARIPVGGPWDPTLDSHMNGIYGLDATQTFEFFPAGEPASATTPKYSGECRIENYAVRSPLGGRNEWSADLQVDGDVTRAEA